MCRLRTCVDKKSKYNMKYQLMKPDINPLTTGNTFLQVQKYYLLFTGSS